MFNFISNARKIIYAILAMVFLIVSSGCEKALNLKDPKSNRVAIFDELWNVMDQRYAMFSFKGVDWNSVYKVYRDQVSDNMTDEQLFQVSAAMLRTLQDGHVVLISGSDTAGYDGFYRPFAVNFNYDNVLNTYLHNEYQTSGPVIYKTEGNIGYLYYGSFANDISDAQMDKIISDMSGTKGLIIDVRSNTGGNSANVDRLASRFIATRSLVKYDLVKSGTGHDDFLDPEPHYLSSTAQFYGQPIIVLTNRTCFSACNDFALYMSGVPNAKLIGDQTGGGGGIPHNYVLANGWKLQYSATATLSPLNKNIENGILPYMYVEISQNDELNGRDPILEKAFETLQ
jgi:hypothetical protein